MAAVLSEVKSVNFGTLKSTWRVSKSQDVINVERDVFVRFIPTSTSLVGLICAQNQHAPSPLPKNFSLTKAVGYQAMIKLRNRTQAEELSQDVDHNACSLFDTPAEVKKRKKTMLSRNAAEEARKNHQIMTIDVGYGSVRVLRPVLQSDSLFVHYSSESLTNMIKFIRDSGFDHGLSWYQDQSLPKGTWRRGCTYCVSYQKEDGTIGYKKCGSIDEVNTFRAEHHAEADACEASADDGDTAVDACEASADDGEAAADACEASADDGEVKCSEASA